MPTFYYIHYTPHENSPKGNIKKVTLQYKVESSYKQKKTDLQK